MNRRGFLGSILALSAAPAIVRADSLMRVVPVNLLVAGPAGFPAGTVRELMVNDVATDDLIYRYDVLGRGVNGALEQCGVDVRVASPAGYESDRRIALTALQNHVQKAGMTLKRWDLPLNVGGIRGRYL